MLSLFFFIDRLCRLLPIFRPKKKRINNVIIVFFIDRLCRLLPIFRPGQDAKLIFFFKINKKEYKKIQKKE